MTTLRVFSSPFFWAGTAFVAFAIGVGCSSSSGASGPTTNGCDGGACDASASSDASGDAGSISDAAHDGPPADALYGACAIPGSFGSPCKLTATGPDPTDCTDTNYPTCFVAPQGSWCTKACSGATDCTTGVADAGCIPTACNGRGFCK